MMHVLCPAESLAQRFFEIFFFFYVHHFKSLYSIYYSIASLVFCSGFLALRHVGS